MYCRKCGKYIPSNADVCADCAAKEAQYTPVTPIVNIPQQQGSLMNGFGKALTAAILGFVGLFCSLFGYLFSVVTFGLSTAGESTESQLIFSILFWVFAVGLAIPALLFGVRSIKLFIAEKKAGHKKAYPYAGAGYRRSSFRRHDCHLRAYYPVPHCLDWLILWNGRYRWWLRLQLLLIK